jgi:tripartite motif-containing protein 71
MFLAVSYNQPKFCALASWDPSAITIADSSAVVMYPWDIFVDTNNTIYVTDYNYNHILVWLEGAINLSKIIAVNASSPYGLFIKSSGDIYVDNGNNGQVDKWSLNASSGVPAMYVTTMCLGLFIDINNTLYCSSESLQQIVSKSLDDILNAPRTVAGTGCAGSASTMLNSPRGIFVDSNFNLYVADFGNNRIQLFRFGQLSGTTVAGNGASGIIFLSGPADVVLDADGYLFIVDRNNNRIIGSGPNGFQCIVGCSGSSGSASNQLDQPRNMAFDSHGNIIVTDYNNMRIQKFVLATNSCGKYQHVL